MKRAAFILALLGASPGCATVKADLPAIRADLSRVATAAKTFGRTAQACGALGDAEAAVVAFQRVDYLSTVIYLLAVAQCLWDAARAAGGAW